MSENHVKAEEIEHETERLKLVILSAMENAQPQPTPEAVATALLATAYVFIAGLKGEEEAARIMAQAPASFRGNLKLSSVPSGLLQ